MSSSIENIDSLSGLADAVMEVEMLFSRQPLTRETFNRLGELISLLQTRCPNHAGVIEARVKWYEWALDSFERQAVCSAERDFWPYLLAGVPVPRPINRKYEADPRVSELLAGTEILCHFLKRSYLKTHFPRLFSRLISLYERIAATNLETVGGLRVGDEFRGMAQGLQKDLLDGRL